MRPVQLAFLLFIECKVFLSSFDSVLYFFIAHTIGPKLCPSPALVTYHREPILSASNVGTHKASSIRVLCA